MVYKILPESAKMKTNPTNKNGSLKKYQIIDALTSKLFKEVAT